MKKPDLKGTNLQLPAALKDPFYAIAERFGRKGAALGAAVAAFLSLSPEDQWSWYLQVMREYYAPASPEEEAALETARQAAGRLGIDADRRRRRAPDARRRPRRG